VLSVSAAAGLLAVAIADTGARSGAGWSEALYWIGLLTLFVPPAIRLALPRIYRGERIGCAVLIGLGMYLMKFLHSPAQFVFGDEFQHWRTAADILATGQLFHQNPLSIAGPYFPGLELVTAAVASVTGLSIYVAGVIVLAVARIVLMVALFLVIEQLSRSARVAGLTCLVYAATPNFTFWSAQFAYESLSLPLAIFIMYLAVRRGRSRDSHRPFDIAILAAGLALTMTHHLTTYALLALLALWSLIAFVSRRRRGNALPAPPIAAFMTAVWAMVWLFVFAPATFQYLVPVVGGAMHDVLQFAVGDLPIKPFFGGDSSLAAPPWERVVAVSAVALIAGALSISLVLFFRRVRTWRRYRVNSLAYAFALGGLLYFPVQALRAVQGSTEISNRAMEFLFLPIGFLLAVTLHYFWLSRRIDGVRIATFSVFATLVFMGGVIIGMPAWARLPGPYLVNGDTRGIQPESLSASAWLRSTFGTDNRVIADRTNELVMGSYGGQDVLHGLSWVFFSPNLGRAELDALRASSVQFIVVDRRVTTMLPANGFYYESGEPGAGQHTEPMEPAQLEKFAESPALTRVFDSGNIAVYALDGSLRGALGPGSDEMTNASTLAAPESGGSLW
jgi:energy-converting hydrogenase Eha subunit C